jgi:hypothetical protein
MIFFVREKEMRKIKLLEINKIERQKKNIAN